MRETNTLSFKAAFCSSDHSRKTPASSINAGAMALTVIPKRPKSAISWAATQGAISCIPLISPRLVGDDSASKEKPEEEGPSLYPVASRSQPEDEFVGVQGGAGVRIGVDEMLDIGPQPSEARRAAGPKK